jgi:hypothetical protein
MSREFRPGDVALVRITSEYPPEIAVRGGGTWAGKWYVAGPRLGSQHGWHEDRIEIIRPLVVIDPEDREQVERLVSAVLTADAAHHEGRACYSTTCHADRMQAALREFAAPKPPRCVAHGNEACADCSRIRTIDFDGGECRHCSTYGTDGMHWDTCPGRIRGPVFANRAEAMGAKS